MLSRWLVLAVMPFCLFGCTVLQQQGWLETKEQGQAPDAWCVAVSASTDMAEPCSATYWLEFFQSTAQQPWSVRRQQIAELGNSAQDRWRKVLLSQPLDTPYNDRLRAQNHINDLLPAMGESLRAWAEVLVAGPSQRLLEYESAVSLLTRMNAEQKNTIEQLREQVQQQQTKLQELLQIETQLLEKNGSSQP